MGIEDPAEATGSPEAIRAAFVTARDQIRDRFARFYLTEILGKELPRCACEI